jgi:hypothetical protein
MNVVDRDPSNSSHGGGPDRPRPRTSCGRWPDARTGNYGGSTVKPVLVEPHSLNDSGAKAGFLLPISEKRLRIGRALEIPLVSLLCGFAVQLEPSASLLVRQALILEAVYRSSDFWIGLRAGLAVSVRAEQPRKGFALHAQTALNLSVAPVKDA